MKNLILIALLAITAVSFTACEKNEAPNYQELFVGIFNPGNYPITIVNIGGNSFLLSAQDIGTLTATLNADRLTINPGQTYVDEYPSNGPGGGTSYVRGITGSFTLAEDNNILSGFFTHAAVPSSSFIVEETFTMYAPRQ